jgi:serine/threonine protein kinase
MPLEENALLGPYRIVGIIGEGGMGAVYRAKDTRLGRDVAIKVLTGVISDGERLARFEQEARATGMLNHPNLLTIYDVGHYENAPFLVSELLEGETLRDRLQRGPFTPRKAVDAASQMANGLAAAHEKGIVHRDLKPDNIFLTRDGRLKILDFGIAKLSGSAEGAFKGAATEPGMVLGTVGYMSPEQVRGENVDQRSDIFAFGAIVYEMIAGRRAFQGNSSLDTLSAILRDDPTELSEILPTVPPPLERLVRRCLEKNRDVRFQSARDLAFNLETLSTLSTPGTMSGSVPRPSTPGSATSSMPTQHGGSAAHIPTTRTPATPTMARGALSPTSAQPAVRAAATARPRTVISKPKRRVSPILIALLFVVAVAAAALGGWYWAQREHTNVGDVSFQRMTFRRGEVRSARFTSDGETIVYSASWDGQPSEVYVASRQSPEARPLEIRDADVMAVSRSTELAVLIKRDRVTGLGTLARVPLAGGEPREVADRVLQADWSPDGANLAIIRELNGRYRLEFPIGKELYGTQHFIRDPRISPDGSKIAFVEQHGGENDIAVIPTAGGAADPIARGWSRGINGMAWAPDGKEIWITGTNSAAPPSLYALPLQGEPRLVSRLTGSMKLFDISPARRVLLSNGMWRAALAWQAPGEAAEREASWLDWSILADLSADGRTILFNETREGGGARSAVYLRRADAPSAIRIGDGFGDALSPDGKLVLSHSGAKLVLMPTGAGQARELKVAGNFDNGAAWLPDSRRVVIGGVVEKEGYRLHLLDTLDEKLTPLTPENIAGGGLRPFAVSPDGTRVAGMSPDEMAVLYFMDGSLSFLAIAGVEKGEIPIRWSADGAAIYVYRPTALPAQVWRIDLAAGRRELWKEFRPIDPAGVYRIAPVCMTPDASAYAYNALRNLSDLYVAENLR